MIAGHIAAVVPTKGHSGLWSLIADMQRWESFDALYVYDNGLSDSGAHALNKVLGRDKRGHVIDARGKSIYRMWNDGWRRALSDFPGQVNVAFLNDDIVMWPETLLQLAVKLRQDPTLWAVCPDYTADVETYNPLERVEVDYVRGTYRNGGICGWCFMVKGELLGTHLKPIDEQFEWWYGDDDLACQIESAGGRLGIVRGLPVRHEGEATASLEEWTHEAKERDRDRFVSKWGNR